MEQKDAVARMLEQDRLQEACDLCHKICATHENDAEIWCRLGEIYGLMGNLDQVINYGRKAISLDPLLAPAYENIANALLRQDKLNEAAQCYWAMAVKMYNAQQFNDAGQALNGYLEVPVAHSKPQTAYAHMLRGACLLALGRNPKALGDLQKAVELQPENSQYQGLLGDTLFALTRFEEACEAYRQLIRLQPESPQAFVSIAIVYERMNQLDAAAGFANQALERDPNHIAAILVLAKLDRRAGNLELACSRLEGARASLSGPAEETELYFESGIVYDRLGRYADAFKLFRQGNKLASQSVRAKVHQESDIQYVDHLTTFRKSFTAERFARWRNTRPKDELPSPIFFVGHPRSGTTLTEQILSAHPVALVSNERPFLDQIIHPILKKAGSIDAAADYLDNISQQELTSMRREYWSQAESMLEVDVSNRILIDKLPANLRKLGFIQRIFPESAVIVALRDPRDVCLSCFMQNFRHNPAMVPFYDIQQTARHYEALMDLWLHYRSILDLRWIESRYEDLVEDYEAVARRLITFLGLDWDDAVLSYLDKERHVSTPSYEDVTSPIFTRAMGRWRNYRKELQPVLAPLSRFIREFGYEE